MDNSTYFGLLEGKKILSQCQILESEFCSSTKNPLHDFKTNGIQLFVLYIPLHRNYYALRVKNTFL